MKKLMFISLLAFITGSALGNIFGDVAAAAQASTKEQQSLVKDRVKTNLNWLEEHRSSSWKNIPQSTQSDINDLKNAGIDTREYQQRLDALKK